jgi:hypothetical protein
MFLKNDVPKVVGLQSIIQQPQHKNAGQNFNFHRNSKELLGDVSELTHSLQNACCCHCCVQNTGKQLIRSIFMKDKNHALPRRLASGINVPLFIFIKFTRKSIYGERY